jgi:C-terminal processing protease CtpA/Prc
LGSKVFLKEELIPISKIKYMINLNMVGGLDSERNIYINGVGTAKEFDSVLSHLNRKYQFNLIQNRFGYSASDANNFFQKSIPVLTFSTGVQEFYNTPYDDISKINFVGIRELSAFVYDLVVNLSQRENSFKFQEQPMPQNRFADLKVDLGIEYKSTKDYVMVNNILQNSIAEQSGLTLEDKITKINGQLIKDRSDFERILSSLYVGQIVSIEFYRDEKKHTIILQL